MSQYIKLARERRLILVRFPIAAAKDGHFQSRAGVFNHFYNGINEGDSMQASDSYTWVIGVLFGAWVC